MPKRVYLIRHGEIEGSAEGKFLGSTDLPLTPHGVSQVRRLAKLLPAGLGAPGAGTRCVASPMLRVQQTAKVVAGHFGLPIRTDADLREIDFGAWEGLTAQEIEERFPGALAPWASPSDDTTYPAGESLGDFERRVSRALERILHEEAEAVLVFAHGGVVRAMVCGLLGLGRDAFWLFAVQPASVARVDLSEGGAILSELWSVADREPD